MLSTTNSVNDLKTRIGNDYSFFGFADDSYYINSLQLALEDAMLEHMYPQITEGYYNLISAKDKVSLTKDENYIYRAEIFFAAYRFLNAQFQKDNQSSLGDSESIAVEGYNRSFSGGLNGLESTASSFLKQAKENLALAGFSHGLRLQRSGMPRTNSTNRWYDGGDPV